MQEKETRKGGIEREKEKEKGVLARKSTRIMHTELGKHFRVIALKRSDFQFPGHVLNNIEIEEKSISVLNLHSLFG